MKQFTGFPTRMQYTPIPNVFLSVLLPRIDDITELKTTLHILGALYRQRGQPRFVTYAELAATRSLMTGLSGRQEPPDEVLRNALAMATRRGTLLLLSLDRDGEREDIYLINTEANREVISRIEEGILQIPGLEARRPVHIDTEEPPDIFTVYEDNIGMLTPMIADELSEAERLYPPTWIRDAIHEAVAQNKRSWRYIAAILKRWSAEGRDNGTYRRHPAKKSDPDKYIKGQYGHMVQR